NAKAVATRLDLEKGLDLAIDEELVPQDPVEVEEVEEQEARARIEDAIGEHERHVVLDGCVEVGAGDAGQAESGELVARVELVVKKVETGEPLVDILGREIDAVVVVPERAERFVDVAVGRMRRGEASEHVRVVVVVELAPPEEVARKAVALGRRV